MTNAIALFFKLPFEKYIYKIISYQDKFYSGTDLEIPSVDCLITVNFHEYLMNITPTELPRKIFDLNSARKLLEGRPKNSYNKGKEPWSGVSVIARSFTDHVFFGKVKKIEENKFGSFKQWEDSLQIGWQEELINAARNEYNNLIRLLKEKDLFVLFTECEMNVLLGFISSSMNGILLDKKRTLKKCLEIDSTYYAAVRDLELKHKYFVNDFRIINSIEDIKEYILGIDPNLFSKKYLWDSIEQYRCISPFLELLYTEHYAKRDLSELLRMNASVSDRCRIQYDIIGTVSGRILISRPGIQYLKKSTRDIFIPSYNNRFIYADYSQFEPGILASLSNDEKLINDYNSGDIYTAIMVSIGNGCTRDIAKQLFLSFIYGMSMDYIKKSIEFRFGFGKGLIIEDFLIKYHNVDIWKKKVSEEAIKQRYARGLTGYYRYFSEDDTDNEIIRWAPNHIIQSTASGIFKSALVKYINRSITGKILVPMHDAILIEVEESNFISESETVKECMIESFREICPKVECKVHFENFYE